MKKIIEANTNIEDFKRDLKEGKPFALYTGNICCGLGGPEYYHGQRMEDGIGNLLEKSNSLVVGFYSCEGHGSIATKSGKVYLGVISDVSADVDNLVDLAVKVNVPGLEDNLLESDLRKKMVGENAQPFELAKSLKERLEKDTLRCMGNLSFRVDGGSYFMLHHIPVEGNYIIEDGRVYGRASGVVKIPFYGEGICNFLETLKPYGLESKAVGYDALSVSFRVDGEVGYAAPGSLYTKDRSIKDHRVAWSLHEYGAEKHKEELIEKVSKIISLPSRYKEIVSRAIEQTRQ